MPAEIDEVERKVTQLEIEREALKREQDPASQERLAKIEKELADLKEKSATLKARWQKEKDVINPHPGRQGEDGAGQDRRGPGRAAGGFGPGCGNQIRSHAQSAKGARGSKTANWREVQKDGAMLKEEVDAEDIAEVVAKWTGIPVTRLLEGEKQKLLHMEERLGLTSRGPGRGHPGGEQRRAPGPFRPPGPQPAAGLLHLPGPHRGRQNRAGPGPGRVPFRHGEAMVRMDMSEYMEKHTVSRLIGAPPGYVGYEEGGQLTEAVRRRPYSVVLFDEIEKAHPEVFNVLLQILDDGRLTDGQGRTVDFRNTIIIMTSNIGSQYIAEAVNEAQLQERVMEALRLHFRPEFLNRVDDILIFHRLTLEQLREIVDLQMARLRKLLAERHLEIELTDQAKDFLAEAGYDPTYGARPLRRAIQRHVQDKLAPMLLSGDFKDGDTILVDRDTEGLRFERKEA